MRAFVIADASKRKAKPIAVLLWEPDGEQEVFTLEVSSECSEGDLPLSLSFCARRERRRATPAESEQWVKSRIVPKDRHNIAEVLAANGLSEYDAVGLFSAGQGRSSDDDYLAYEINLPEEVADGIAAPKGVQGARPAFADRLLAGVSRRRAGGKVNYALVSLEDPPDGAEGSPAYGHDDSFALARSQGSPGGSERSARRIGSLIRTRRLEAGLTQKKLAAKAGITQTVLSRVESGAGNPTLSLLEELAAALNSQLEVSLSDAECGNGPRSS